MAKVSVWDTVGSRHFRAGWGRMAMRQAAQAEAWGIEKLRGDLKVAATSEMRGSVAT